MIRLHTLHILYLRCHEYHLPVVTCWASCQMFVLQIVLFVQLPLLCVWTASLMKRHVYGNSTHIHTCTMLAFFLLPHFVTRSLLVLCVSSQPFDCLYTGLSAIMFMHQFFLVHLCMLSCCFSSLCHSGALSTLLSYKCLYINNIIGFLL